MDPTVSSRGASIESRAFEFPLFVMVDTMLGISGDETPNTALPNFLGFWFEFIDGGVDEEVEDPNCEEMEEEFE